jgi:2',3'-cyclic-nucleotide 2'-phosphodiesterase/3'-nucleotidase/5'-nucleotidase
VLVANEAEPSEDYTVDPEGSVSVIDVRGRLDRLTQDDVRTAGFSGFNGASLDSSVRVYGPGASVAQDLEPEYIAVDRQGKTAWVTLQENNAIAELDVRRAEITAIHGLGFKDHSLPGNGLDASDRDGAISIRTWPVKGMFQPDSIAAFRTGGATYIALANEGDARDWAAFAEEARVGALTLDPVAFPDRATLRADANLGRLTVTSANGDTDGDGDFDELYALGARSFSIRRPDGTLVFDSADALEQVTAAAFPANFNADNAGNAFDNRSDNKGPEPEGLALGEVKDRTYAFVGLERIGGVAVYDVTEPASARLVTYRNDRNFAGSPSAGTAGDLGPEGLLFIPGWQSPTGGALLVVAHEISGTTAIYAVESAR